MRRLRSELRLLLIVFPAVLLIGRLFEFLLSSEVIEAAVRHQRDLMSDLGKFTPFELIAHIWDSIWVNILIVLGHPYVPWEEADGIVGYVAQFAPLIYRLPIALVFAIWTTVASVWDTETVLASVLVTLSFIAAVFIGIAVSEQARFGSKYGFWGIIPGCAVVYAAGTLLCGVLWGLVWVGGSVFGWFTDLAGYCMVCGGAVTAGWLFAVEYAGFRGAHAAERLLEPHAAPAKPSEPKNKAEMG